MKYFMALAALTLLLSGCKKEEPNPELMDPIYQDLTKRQGDAEKAFADEKASQQALRDSMDKAEANSPELRNAKRDFEKSLQKIVIFDQNARYYKIRAQRRLLVDRISYKTAFSKDEKWPDPHEYSEYLVNTRLREVPLNWNSRVPRLRDRLPSSDGKAKKAGETAPKAEE
jgi:hypothetical protein